MTVNRTTLLDLPLPVTGTESNTWGDITNNGLTEYMDIAIAGMSNLTSANFTAGALTIETTEGNSAGTSITATSAQYAGFRVTSLAANSTITVGNTGTSPARSYRLINADATYSLTFKATGQTGVTLLPGQSAVVAFNGTDYVIVGTVGAGTATDNAVARFDGTTGEILQNSAATIDDTGAATFVGSVNVSGTSASAADLKLYEDTDNGTNYVAFKSPASVASNVTWTLPSADGTNGQALTTNGSGTLAFSSVTTAPGGSTTQVQYNNAGAFAGSSNLTFDGTNLTSGGTVTATKLIPTGNVTAGNGMYLPTTNTLAFSTDGSERMRILSGGKVLINATTDRDKWDNSTIGSNLLQVERSVSGGNSSISIATNPGTSADVFSLLLLGRSRGTANNDYTAVASGDGLGAISFQGADGTEFVEAASIRGHVDGTPGANDMPGRLMFFTTPDGSATSTERMRITSAGNVGIGTSSPAVPLDVVAQTSASIARFRGRSSDNIATLEWYDNTNATRYTYISSGPSSSSFWNQANTPMAFGTNDTERMRIDSSGNLLVGTTDSSATAGPGLKYKTSSTIGQLALVNNSSDSGITPITLYNVNASNTGYRFYVKLDGGIANYSANNVNLSDRREKINFAPAGEYLSKICAIPVQTFNYIDQNLEEDGGLTLGVVAQDVQEVAPELVMESDWGTKDVPKIRLSVYQTDLQYALMKSIQELKAIVDAQAARIAALEIN
jgi:hypothetical protein